MKNMEYTMPMTEGGSPLPLSGYTIDWPIEMTMGYNINDLIQKFGYRIQDAIRTPLCGETGLDDRTMKNKTKWWKFWNRDLRNAYMNYTGEVYDDKIDYRPKYINHWNNRDEKYSKNLVNPDYYETLLIRGDYNGSVPQINKKTVPASEDSPTLAPEHPEKSAVKKKLPSPRKKRIHEHTFELDGGPCLKCGKTVSEMISEDITNYNKKHVKSK